MLSQALVEQRGTFKMVELVGALEAWLLPRRAAGQTFRLARAIAYFGCGRGDDDLCGRSRATCPYLELNPDIPAERSKLKRLRIKGALPPWRCSEWHRVVDWYDDRSEVVHGSGPVISYKEASNSLVLGMSQPRRANPPVAGRSSDGPSHRSRGRDRCVASCPGLGSPARQPNLHGGDPAHRHSAGPN